MEVEAFCIVFLLVISGFLSMSEIAIISSRKSRLRKKAEEGSHRYQKVLELSINPGQFLSTIQVGITLIGILLGAMSDAIIVGKLRKELQEIPFLGPYADTIGFCINVLGITLVTLLVAELVPKRIALNNPERIAAFSVYPIRFFSLLLYPFARLLTSLTEGILWLLRIRPSTDPPISEEEVRVLLREGREAGIFHQVEQNLVENVFYLDDKGTHTFLTPRTDIIYLDKNEEPQALRELIIMHEYSHYPVCDGDIDHVIGVITSLKVLSAMATNSYTHLKDFIEPPVLIPSSVSTLRVLALFKERKTSMAIMVDEHGGVLGIMTLHSILEKLLGEATTSGMDHPRIIRREDGSYLIDGILPFKDFVKYFHCEKDYKKEKVEYHTMAGFILQHMGHIPKPAHYFVWKTFYFEVIDMDGNRVDKILVRPFEKKYLSYQKH